LIVQAKTIAFISQYVDECVELIHSFVVKLAGKLLVEFSNIHVSVLQAMSMKRTEQNRTEQNRNVRTTKLRKTKIFFRSSAATVRPHSDAVTARPEEHHLLREHRFSSVANCSLFVVMNPYAL